MNQKRSCQTRPEGFYLPCYASLCHSDCSPHYLQGHRIRRIESAALATRRRKLLAF